MLLVNLQPASSLFHADLQRLQNSYQQQQKGEVVVGCRGVVVVLGGVSVAKRVGGHILSMSNRLVNNHCQQERTKDQKSAIVI